MPFVFLLAWVSCVATCTEYAENNKDQNSELTAQGNGDVQLIEASHCSENCFLTNPAALQERQNVTAPALIIESVWLLPMQSEVAVSHSVAASDINQNSPPARKSSPIYLLLCNFRI